MQFQNSNYYSNNFGLKSSETERLHVTKAGKVQARPYPMAISFSKLGLKPAAKPLGFINVLAARQAANEDPFIGLAG